MLLSGIQSVVELTHLQNNFARKVFDFHVLGDPLSQYREAHGRGLVAGLLQADRHAHRCCVRSIT